MFGSRRDHFIHYIVDVTYLMFPLQRMESVYLLFDKKLPSYSA